MMINMQSNKLPVPLTEKLFKNVRTGPEISTHTFAPFHDDISLNYVAATFPLGGGVIRKAPHDVFLRFE
jgi:hypothetical protein